MNLLRGIFFILVLASVVFLSYKLLNRFSPQVNLSPQTSLPQSQASPLQILSMRQRSYPGSDLKIEQTLEPGSNYSQYVASYYSDGLKIYGLLTVPTGQKPEGGWGR